MSSSKIIMARDGQEYVEVKVSEEDYDYLVSLSSKWVVLRCKGKISAVGMYKDPRYLLMHRAILKPDRDKVVDHINSDPTDNRRENLRIVSVKENCHNIKKPITNTSGYLNVGYRKDRNHWKVMVTGIYLGSFKNKEDAVRAAILGRAKLLPCSKEAEMLRSGRLDELLNNI